MVEKIGQINSVVNAFVWGRGMLVIFLGVGMLFTLRTGFFQFKGWKVWMGDTLGALFRDRRVRRAQDHQSISQFQSFCTALAATLGTGNITGVATAIVTGGPGAVFWMWVSAFLGMMTIYAEMCSGSNIVTKPRRCMGWGCDGLYGAGTGGEVACSSFFYILSLRLFWNGKYDTGQCNRKRAESYIENFGAIYRNDINGTCGCCDSRWCSESRDGSRKNRSVYGGILYSGRSSCRCDTL